MPMRAQMPHTQVRVCRVVYLSTHLIYQNGCSWFPNRSGDEGATLHRSDDDWFQKHLESVEKQLLALYGRIHEDLLDKLVMF